jgi:hypothetical protein
MPYICVLWYYQIKIKQNFSHIIRVNSENGIMMGPLLGKENAREQFVQVRSVPGLYN